MAIAATRRKAARQEALAQRIDTLTVPEGAQWATEARRGALARLRDMGLPTRRDEYWRFTRPDDFAAAAPPPAPVFDNSDEAPLFDGIDRLLIVFTDGAFDAEASDDLTGEGVEIERLSAATAADIHWAKDLYGVLEGRGHDPVERPFAAMNTATATDGIAIRATGRAARPIHLHYRRTTPDTDAVLHFLVKVESGAEVTVLENGPAAARFSQVMEVDVADGGTFHHVRAQGRDHERRAITHVFARVGAGSTFKSFTLTANGVLTRNEAVIELAGDGGTAHVAGAALGDGAFHHDDTVFVTHDAVGCESRQVFKKVLRHGAVGAFQGKILVKPGAQKTDGYQISQSLLLDEDAEFLAKPELEIYADDVACSHGSTTGAIDETALFYLRSRGVPRRVATDMLVLSFLAEAVAEIADEDLRAHMTELLADWQADA